MSRAQTLVFALLALHLLLGALSLVIGRGEHKSAALRWWGWGLIAYAAGLVLTMPVIPLPAPVALTLGNVIITAAPVACAMGVLAHTPWRMPVGWAAAGVLATAVVLATANATGSYRIQTNLAAPSVMAIVMFLLAARAIATDAPRDARVAGRFLAAVLVFAVATWVARIAVMLALLEGTQERERIDLVISLFAILQMVNGVASTLALFWIDVRLMQAELSRVAHTDALTGLPNRRAVLTRFHEEVARAARRGERFALAVFDLDFFKRVNDQYGHVVGDEVLKAAAAAFASAKRSEDVLARIGGEEFLVVLSSTRSREGAIEAAERMRESVARIELKAGGEALKLTTSGGVSLYPEEGSTWDALFAAADRRLYAAKQAGRDRVVGPEAPGEGNPLKKESIPA
jgi:diguanylate cyclase (GGDEF)-like protein